MGRHEGADGVHDASVWHAAVADPVSLNPVVHEYLHIEGEWPLTDNFMSSMCNARCGARKARAAGLHGAVDRRSQVLAQPANARRRALAKRRVPGITRLPKQNKTKQNRQGKKYIYIIIYIFLIMKVVPGRACCQRSI